jgi:hypothetical protein
MRPLLMNEIKGNNDNYEVCPMDTSLWYIFWKMFSIMFLVLKLINTIDIYFLHYIELRLNCFLTIN